MNNNYYTSERNSQIVISLLKAHGIKYIVTSPGTTHMCFVGSIQHDPFFKVFSCVDERSAAYMACGLAAESGETVVITCTGATASRNYYSALTEAYYRKLPIIAITAHQGTDRIGHLLEQNIDRRNIPYDVAKISVEAIWIENQRDERFCEIEVNKAILECKRYGGGPVHINLFTRYSKDFTVREFPPTRVIHRYTAFEELPTIPQGRIAVFIGSHRLFTRQETDALDRFCATHDAVVFCDHTSGYYGRYKVHFSFPLSQQNYDFPQRKVNILVHIGEVSGDAYSSRKIQPQSVWRVSEDGELRDTWGKLERVFEMPEEQFFTHYSDNQSNFHSYLDECLDVLNEIRDIKCDLPLSNIWVAQQTALKLPKNSSFHTGIWSSLRSMNFFDTPNCVSGNCNVGGFGIDGILSSLVGASLANPNKLYFGVVGDLAFFYDMNVLGNRHIGNNIRIIVVNNGRGNEMRYNFSPAATLGEEGNLFLAASGHYENKSQSIIKSYVEALGYKYFFANSKEDFLKLSDKFFSVENFNSSMIFEVFVEDYLDEDRAWQQITSLKVDNAFMLKKNIKSTIKEVVGDSVISKIKTVIGK